MIQRTQKLLITSDFLKARCFELVVNEVLQPPSDDHMIVGHKEAVCPLGGEIYLLCDHDVAKILQNGPMTRI